MSEMKRTARVVALSTAMGFLCGVVFYVACGGGGSSGGGTAVVAESSVGAVLGIVAGAPAASTSVYHMPWGVGAPDASPTSPTSTADLVLPRAGTLQNLYIAPFRGPVSGIIVSATLVVNGVDTALTATHHAYDGATPASDALSIKVTESAGVSAPTSGTWMYGYEITYEFR